MEFYKRDFGYTVEAKKKVYYLKTSKILKNKMYIFSDISMLNFESFTIQSIHTLTMLTILLDFSYFYCNYLFYLSFFLMLVAVNYWI